MKTIKSKVSTLVLFASLLVLIFSTGCASNRTENISRLGTATTLDLSSPHVHFLGSYDGQSTGVRLLFIGGSPSAAKAEQRAKAAAFEDAKKQGISPGQVRFVNPNSSKSGGSAIIAGIKKERVIVEAYWIDNDKTPSTPAVTPSTPVASTTAPLVNNTK